MAEGPVVRLDVWLDVACICRTRSQAQTACKQGKVEINGARAKSHRTVHVGDEIRISFRGGRKRIVVVREVVDTHVAKARARELYEDHTPQPTAEELELRRMQRLSLPPRRERGAGAPKKKERRDLKRIKEEWSG